MLELYGHNQAAYESALSLLKGKGKAAVIHPTGTGKSFIAFRLCGDFPGGPVCWVSPSRYIYRTQVENLRAAGGEAPGNIRFLTYARLMRMGAGEAAGMRPSLIVLDEFHRAGAEMWSKGVGRLLGECPGTPVLGLSATNIRYLDGRRDMAEELFGGCVASELTLGECIARGVLRPPKYVLSVYAYQEGLERYRERVGRVRGRAARARAEECLEELRRALEKADGLAEVFGRHMADRRGKYIVFCAGKRHMEEMMGKAGEWFSLVDRHPKVYSVYSGDPGAGREFEAFRADGDRGRLRLLYCIDALNEGIHVGDVSGVVLLRPTVSPTVYKQQIGRALSAGGTGEPVIFDIVMNIDNLCSIDTVEEEVRAACHFPGAGDAGAAGWPFRVYDELGDCRELFGKLNDTLAASWEDMYGHAREYYESEGDLEVPRRYRTADGYSLGSWVAAQRGVYHGEARGTLGEERVRRLEEIGMEWGGTRERSWKRCLAAAEKYAAEKGDLLVPAPYVTGDGIRLGRWVASLRAYRKGGVRKGYLTEGRIAELDRIGMVWDMPDCRWERYYHAAQEYSRAHGGLDVPSRYVTADGVRLGAWLDGLRGGPEGGGACRLTEGQRQALEGLGMSWQKKNLRKWEEGYAEAEAWYREHGHLEVPCGYRGASGFALGRWVGDQREALRTRGMDPGRKERLDRIGMVWEKGDPWEARFRLAEAYFREHGDLKVPASYTAEGVRLNKWVNEQKQVYRGRRPGKALTEGQARRLEAIGMEWGDGSGAAQGTAGRRKGAGIGRDSRRGALLRPVYQDGEAGKAEGRPGEELPQGQGEGVPPGYGMVEAGEK